MQAEARRLEKQQIIDDIQDNPIILYMKGTKDMPMCGFSNSVVQVLNHYGIEYKDINILEDQDFFNFKVSVKSSDVFLSVAAYRLLSKKTDYPLHLGITESGSFVPGSVKSSIGLGVLLLEGIGDTLRVSLSDDPVKEIKVGNEILKSLNLRSRGVKIISCPSCARQGFDVIETVKKLEDKLSHIKTPITLSIIGCVVNGPGEAAMTDIGLTAVSYTHLTLPTSDLV